MKSMAKEPDQITDSTPVSPYPRPQLLSSKGRNPLTEPLMLSHLVVALLGLIAFGRFPILSITLLLGDSVALNVARIVQRRMGLIMGLILFFAVLGLAVVLAILVGRTLNPPMPPVRFVIG